MAGKQQQTTGRGKKTSSSGKKKTTKRKTTAKNTRKIENLTPEEKEQQKGIRDDVLVVSVLAASILLTLSNFNLCGKFGEILSNVMFGLFGYMAYIFPFVLFFGISFLVANRNNHIAKIKFTAAAFGYVFITILIHMVTEPYDPSINAIQACLNSASGHNGGGFFGGLAVWLLHPLLGTVGCYVLIIALIMICAVLVTQRSIFIPLGKKGKKAYSKASMQRKQRRDEKKAEKAEKAAEQTRGTGGNRNVSFEEIKEKFENKDLNFDLSAASEAPKVISSKPTESFEENIQENEKKMRVVKKPLVDDIEEEIILPPSGEDVITVNHMEPIELKEEDGIPDLKSSDFGMTSGGDMRPIIVEDDEIPAPSGDSLIPSESAAAKASAKAEAMKMGAPTEAEKQVTAEQIETALEQKPEYIFPPLSLLERGKVSSGDSDEYLRETAMKLKSALDSFGVKVQVTNVTCGPTVTQYELQPEQGVKVSKILSLANDIKLNLAVSDIRIEAPIPGKAAIGIEVPNKKNIPVKLRDLLESREFQQNHVQIPFAVGRDISGKVIVGDISSMPHLLIAGATGSGKSVCINTLIMSIIYSSKPEDIRLIMIDPKVVELSVYNGIPHLLIPVVTDPKKAAGALNWAVMEMTDRYKKFAELNVRDLKGYNAKVSQAEIPSPDYPRLPKIVIIVDELADLMMVASNEVEDAICRLAQLARACGIHLVIATQRPSVNVITGTIKANILSRIAFTVASQVDSRTIIDMAGAEKLLGKGDMLYAPGGTSKPVRVQGAFVSDEEVNSVVEFLKESQNGYINYNDEVTSKISNASTAETSGNNERDGYFVEAGKFIIERDKASIGMLQRVFKIGFNRAARIMEQLHDAGVVGPEEGTKPRKVLMSPEEFENYIEEYL